MPDYSWKCDRCETSNPPYTEVCRDCGLDYQATKHGLELRARQESAVLSIQHHVAQPALSMPQANPVDESVAERAEKIRRSVGFKAFLFAVLVCVLQVGVLVLGFVVQIESVFVALYFYTAFPGTLLEVAGARMHDGFFGLPSLQAYGIGLFLWGLIYYFAAIYLLKSGDAREDRNPPTPS